MGMDPRNTMPDHPNYDPYTSYKLDRSNDMMLNVMASEDMIGLTERFAPSAAAFGWVVCNYLLSDSLLLLSCFAV